ncbi:DUF2141 domain-containing protein [Lacinutrix sp. C3R15]|nr:DUF2141 domain-containing protein [Lacinutrix sp. C3R15]
MAKSLALLLVFILSTFNSHAQSETEGKQITVTVKNIKNTNGKVILSLHNASTFMKGKGLESSITEINGDTATLTFKNVIPGEYAIMGVHDENSNNQMDFELNGMPKESYGMSNNPILYGPPTFDAAKFELKKEDVNITIRF